MNSDSDFGLGGRVALVTGSSKGIGAAIAIELARAGASVILHGSKPSESLEQTAAQLSESGCEVKVCCCDFGDRQALDGFADIAWAEYDNIDILVNNAGGDVLTGAPATWSAERKLDYLYDIDCRATYILSRQVGARMKSMKAAAGTRSIINIGWDQALQGMEGESGEFFSTIKGGIMSMALSLAQSLAPEVRVNCVAPGWIRTQWGQQSSEYWSNRATSECLMNRWGTVQDVANAVAFLASDRASFIAGQILSVNGGFRFSQLQKSTDSEN